MKVILIIYSLFGFIIIEAIEADEVFVVIQSKDPPLGSSPLAYLESQSINHLTNPPFFRFGMV